MEINHYDDFESEMLKKALLSALLFDLEKNNEDLTERLLKKYGNAGGYRVIALKAAWIDNTRLNFSFDDIAITNSLLREQLEEAFPQTQELIFLHDRILYIIWKMRLDEVESQQNFCKKAVSLGSSVYKCPVFLGISSYYSELYSLRVARMEADRGLIRSSRQNNAIISKDIHEISLKSQSSHMSLDKLNAAIQSGNGIMTEGKKIAQLIREMPKLDEIQKQTIGAMIDLILLCEKSYSCESVLIENLKVCLIEASQMQTSMEVGNIFEKFCSSIEAYSKQIEFGKDEYTIQTAQKYIREHISEKITLERVANEVYLSRFYFCKLFKQVCSQNFNDYICSQRIEYSLKELNRNPCLKTYEVAEMAGFASPRYFAAIFKKSVGMTPQQYKKEVLHHHIT